MLGGFLWVIYDEVLSVKIWLDKQIYQASGIRHQANDTSKSP